jgi:hypothetical protein
VANPATREYGLNNPTFSGTVTGFRLSDTQANATTGALTFASAATAASAVGRYSIQGGGLVANNGNYIPVQAPSNETALSVTPALLTYVANPATREYGLDNPPFSGTVTGFRVADTLANATTGTLIFSSPATVGSPVGGYPIDGSGLSATNYSFVPAPQNATALTITKAPLTYVADQTFREYGFPNPTLTGSVTGFRNNENLSGATTGTALFTSPATPLSNPGRYPIAGSGLVATNYQLVQAPSNATALAVTAGETLYQINSDIPTFDRTPGFTDTNVYASGFLLPSMCIATDPMVSLSGTAATGDILEIEWARVRVRPKLTNCVSIGDRDYCRDF